MQQSSFCPLRKSSSTLESSNGFQDDTWLLSGSCSVGLFLISVQSRNLPCNSFCWICASQGHLSLTIGPLQPTSPHESWIQINKTKCQKQEIHASILHNFLHMAWPPHISVPQFIPSPFPQQQQSPCWAAGNRLPNICQKDASKSLPSHLQVHT